MYGENDYINFNCVNNKLCFLGNNKCLQVFNRHKHVGGLDWLILESSAELSIRDLSGNKGN